MTWTTDMPTVPGYYWWKRTYGKRAIQTIVLVKRNQWKRDMLFIQSCKRVEDCRGHWAGPLVPPEEP